MPGPGGNPGIPGRGGKPGIPGIGMPGIMPGIGIGPPPPGAAVTYCKLDNKQKSASFRLLADTNPPARSIV